MQSLNVKKRLILYISKAIRKNKRLHNNPINSISFSFSEVITTNKAGITNDSKKNTLNVLFDDTFILFYIF